MKNVQNSIFIGLVYKSLGNIIESETLQLRNIESNSLVFECVADNGVDEPLKKKVIISVSGKRSLHSLISFFRKFKTISN